MGRIGAYDPATSEDRLRLPPLLGPRPGQDGGRRILAHLGADAFLKALRPRKIIIGPRSLSFQPPKATGALRAVYTVHITETSPDRYTMVLLGRHYYKMRVMGTHTDVAGADLLRTFQRHTGRLTSRTWNKAWRSGTPPTAD